MISSKSFNGKYLGEIDKNINKEREILFFEKKRTRKDGTKGKPRIIEEKLNIAGFKKKLDLLGYQYLIIIDIDDFTLINKKYGIFEGNNILEILLKIFQEILPIEICFGYLGRDEFIFSLKEWHENFPEKIRDAVKNYNWREINNSLFVTLTTSISVRGIKEKERIHFRDMSFRSIREDIDHWLIRTAWGIKDGKVKGKNKIVSAPKYLPEDLETQIRKYDRVFEDFSDLS